MANRFNLTGYGPSRLIFDGDQDKYGLWKIIFLDHLRLHNLLYVITADDVTTIEADVNAKVFAELALMLDDRSISIIIKMGKQ